MENYAKTILYAYPLLETVEEDYAEHIRNKAALSYHSAMPTEALAEYLAGEILCKQNLVWLRNTVSGVLDRLNEEERALLEIRFFGNAKKMHQFLKKPNEKGKGGGQVRVERGYFRRQKRLGDKVGAMLRCAGITENVYFSEFKDLEIFRKIHRFVEAGRDQKLSAVERRWIEEN